MAGPTNSATVAIVARLISETFVISEADALEKASGLVTLAEGWGGAGASAINWADEIMKRYGDLLDWRSESSKLEFLRGRNATAKAYEAYIRARK
jgi:hypothetical protein